MKKLLALILATAMVLSYGVVMAEQDNSVEGTLTENTLTVTYNEGEKGVATLTLFDDGALVGAKTARFENDCYTFALSEEDADKDMRIYFYNEEIYPVTITTPEPTEAPTEAPTETATPKPTKTPYPEAYEKPLDAINAPAVVGDVAAIDVDGELYYELTLWYQGRGVITNVREKVVIETAPTNVSYLVGKTVNYLQAGDVIHITCDLQGRIKSVEFLYRPDFADYFENDISTAGMIGDDGWSEYYFGAAVETYSTSMEIAGADGKVYDLDVSPDAFVYTVSPTRKGAYIELKGIGAKLVPTAFIPDENIVDGVVLWDGVTEIPYVLARISRDIVTDIIVFE